jgi:hypothetical protein
MLNGDSGTGANSELPNSELRKGLLPHSEFAIRNSHLYSATAFNIQQSTFHIAHGRARRKAMTGMFNVECLMLNGDSGAGANSELPNSEVRKEILLHSEFAIRHSHLYPSHPFNTQHSTFNIPPGRAPRKAMTGMFNVECLMLNGDSSASANSELPNSELRKGLLPHSEFAIRNSHLYPASPFNTQHSTFNIPPGRAPRKAMTGMFNVECLMLNGDSSAGANCELPNSELRKGILLHSEFAIRNSHLYPASPFNTQHSTFNIPRGRAAGQ